jgi:hypothetical protein
VRTFLRLYEPVQAHRALLSLWADVKPWLLAGHALDVVVRPERRSTAQNARMWAMLNDVSRDVVWHGRNLTPEEWKHVFTAALTKQDVVPGIDGTGFVVLGKSTSAMSVREVSDLIDLIDAFGSERSVAWTDPTREPVTSDT